LLDNNIASIREKINLRGGDIVEVCLNGDEIVKN
jgi:AbrB family looped-hinge helix DNA binding protein